MAERNPYLEEEPDSTCRVISLYRDIESILQSDEFTENLRKKRQNSNRDIVNDIQKRREDLENTDNCILITGDTYSGKSTLVNKILERRIFNTGNMESIPIVKKIRNSDRIRIITESETGKVEETDLTDRCDLGTKEGMAMLRRSLMKLTYEIHIPGLIADIGFPTSVLKNHTILVEVPCYIKPERLTYKLMELLQHAVSFIYVINAGSCDGINSDSLSFILNAIQLLQEKDMVGFDPKSILFITNQWDTFFGWNNSDDEDSDDNGAVLVWESLKSDLRNRWPNVKEGNIFRMNLKNVLKKSPSDKEQFYVEQFKAFKKLMESNVQKNVNVRIMRHLRFIQDILIKVSTILEANLDLGKSETFEMDLIEAHLKKIVMLECDCKQARETLQKRINRAIEETAQTCYDFMSRDDGKDVILNPSGRHPILQILCRSKINDLVRQYVNKFLRSTDVLKKFKGIRGEIVFFYHNTSLELSKMENEWTYDQGSKVSVCDALETSPFCLPEFTIAGVSLSWIHFLIPFLNTDRKQNLIDETYDHYLSLIRSSICNHLQSSYGLVIKDLLDKVTKDLLPKRINYLKEIIDQCQGAQEKYLRQQKLERLALDVRRLQKNATELQESIEYMTQVEEANNGML